MGGFWPWPRSEKPIFISCGRAACDAGLLDWSAPENAAIELAAATLLGPNGPDLISALQTWQPTVCLVFDPKAAQALAVDVPFRFIGFDARHFTVGQLKLLATRTKSYVMVFQGVVTTHSERALTLTTDTGSLSAPARVATAPCT